MVIFLVIWHLSNIDHNKFLLRKVHKKELFIQLSTLVGNWNTLFTLVIQFCTNHFSPITHAIEQMLHDWRNVLSNIHLTSFDIVSTQAKSRILTKVNTLKPIDGKIGCIITYKESSNCCNISLTLITIPKTLTIGKD